MGLSIGSIVLRVDDIARAGAFWRQALGYRSAAGNEAFLRPQDGNGFELHLDDTDRTHLDLWTVETPDVEGEVERLVELGARRAVWQYPVDANPR